MRKKIIIGLAVLAFAAIIAVICLAPVRVQPKRWTLADGTQISLAGVTYGTNHAMRYGNRLVDYLYPALSAKLRSRYQCRVATFPTGTNSAVMVWLWDNSTPKTPGSGVASWRRADRFQLVTIDEHGMESEPIAGLFSRWAQGRNYLYGCALPQFPRRSREIRVRIYDDSVAPAKVAGEFTVRNRLATRYPEWKPSPLPATVATNGVEVSLTAFEIGLNNTNRPYSGLYNRAPESISHAELSLTSSADGWRICAVHALAATGEAHWLSSLRGKGTAWGLEGRIPPDPDQKSDDLPARADIRGTCWLEEPAWKLRAELMRTTNFPPNELWVIKGVKIPEEGEVNELGLKTNIYATEIEFVGLWNEKRGSATRWQVGDPLPAQRGLLAPAFPWTPGKIGSRAVLLKFRSPVNMRPGTEGLHLKLAEIRDDAGRKVRFEPRGSMGGFVSAARGAPRMEENFALDLADDVESVDVTLAYTKSIFVEFMAKPTVAKPDATK